MPEENEKNLKLLNSRLGIKTLLAQEELNIDRAIRNTRNEKELRKLQIELLKLQDWVTYSKKRVIIIFEGRDAAGKSGAIRRITHYLNPRLLRIVALPKPTEEELHQWYFQRYVYHFPKYGEILFLDRSWYNRAIVEPVNGFCTDEEYERFMNEVNDFEKMLVNENSILIKVYFSISKEEQLKRFNSIIHNPLKKWKYSAVDSKAQNLWERYTEYKDKMFERTNTSIAPWKIIKANRKGQARLDVIKYILKQIPYLE